MNNNKAIEDDEIQLELIKYGPQIHHQAMSNILNRIFEEYKNKINLVLYLQLLIPKPNKMKRPRKYSMRKILSTATLQRIKDKVDNFYLKVNQHIETIAQ